MTQENDNRRLLAIAEEAIQLARVANEKAEALRVENERLRWACALLKYRRKRGRPKKSALPAGSQGRGRGRKARYSDDDLAAAREYIPALRKMPEYREWLAQHDRRDSKTSALTFMLALVYPGRGLRSSRAFHDVETLRRRLNDWEKRRAK